jgi:rhodanese-related sulfurtransferase
MIEQIKHYEQKLAFEWDSFDLFDNLEKGQNIVIIDTRKEHAFDNEHIPTAINFPHRTMNAQQTAHLDKSPIYVCYCDGIGCNASTKGSLNMAKLGFNVRELIGGLDWWKRDGYATQGTEAKAGTEMQCAC